jgi:hypothetical protein
MKSVFARAPPIEDFSELASASVVRRGGEMVKTGFSIY